ncbi:MAG: DUF1343 domain-containing protein, partial [Planctomycetales bacterium]|nr:DUF1343 domain-containing protein [Planctomycetales bacterium]
LTVAHVLRRLYPRQWETKSLNRLLADERTWKSLVDGKPVAAIQAEYQDELTDFLRRRDRFLLYDAEPRK